MIFPWNEFIAMFCVCKIYEGTSEIQRLVISRQIKSEDKFNGLGEE
jgi:alkylation response protein AidB-like acyl-CoA dehydrogenase